MKIKNILKNEIYLEKLGALAHSCNLENLNSVETKKVFKESGYPAHYSKKTNRKRMWDSIPYSAEVIDDYPSHLCDKIIEKTTLNFIFSQFGSLVLYTAIKMLASTRLALINKINGVIIEKKDIDYIAIYEEVDKFEPGSGLNLIYFINKK